MTTFAFTTLTNNPDSAQYESACLGADASNKLTDNDIGKCVKLETGSAASNYVLCADGDEIEGILVATEPATYNDGFAFGTVQRKGRFEATVGTAATVVVGTAVVSYAQAAIDTAGGAVVKNGSPATFLWRCIRIVSGTGAAGDTVLLERV